MITCRYSVFQMKKGHNCSHISLIHNKIRFYNLLILASELLDNNSNLCYVIVKQDFRMKIYNIIKPLSNQLTC